MNKYYAMLSYCKSKGGFTIKTNVLLEDTVFYTETWYKDGRYVEPKWLEEALNNNLIRVPDVLKYLSVEDIKEIASLIKQQMRDVSVLHRHK